MENLQERLSQCQKDIKVLREQETELREQIEKQKTPKFGNIVEVKSTKERRVVLYDEGEKLLWAFSKDGQIVGNAVDSVYCQTGKNIFTDNLLNLDD